MAADPTMNSTSAVEPVHIPEGAEPLVVVFVDPLPVALEACLSANVHPKTCPLAVPAAVLLVQSVVPQAPVAKSQVLIQTPPQKL